MDRRGSAGEFIAEAVWYLYQRSRAPSNIPVAKR